jgi:hypothetical protein
VSNDGARIEGRRQWREHLKANDLVELGHADIKDAESAQEKKRRAALEKVERLQKEVIGKWEEPEPLPDNEPAKKRLWCKVAERLENREQPTRKQLIRVVVEELRRLH